MTRALRAFRLAMAFLTIIPIPLRDDEATPSRLADARFAYPIVGALIGLVMAGLSEALRAIGAPAGPSAFLLVASAAIISGGLHLDGLADSADGLFLWGDPARRLGVMRDPHVGSFGVSAAVLVLLGKFAAIEAIGGPSRSIAILGGATVARSLVLVSAGTAPYARTRGGPVRFLVEATPTGRGRRPGGHRRPGRRDGDGRSGRPDRLIRRPVGRDRPDRNGAPEARRRHRRHARGSGGTGGTGVPPGCRAPGGSVGGGFRGLADRYVPYNPDLPPIRFKPTTRTGR